MHLLDAYHVGQAGAGLAAHRVGHREGAPSAPRGSIRNRVDADRRRTGSMSPLPSAATMPRKSSRAPARMAGMPVADRQHRLGDLDAFGLQVVAQRHDQGDLDADIRDGQARPHRGDEGRGRDLAAKRLGPHLVEGRHVGYVGVEPSALTTRASEEPAAASAGLSFSLMR